MIAVQALSKRSEQQNKQLEALRAENAALKAQARTVLLRLAAVEKSRIRQQGSR